MNAKFQKITFSLLLSLVITLSGCVGFGDPLDAEDQEKIDQQIREAIEKTFPLPEQVTIKTHVGDDLRFTTDLSLEEVIAFYRDAYAQKGYVEESSSQVSDEDAALLFKKDGEKDVVLEAAKTEHGCEVHLLLK